MSLSYRTTHLIPVRSLPSTDVNILGTVDFLMAFSFLKICENNTKQQKKNMWQMVRNLQSLKYSLSVFHVVTQRFGLLPSYDSLLLSLSGSAKWTPILHDSAFSSHSKRSHMVPPNCSGAGKCTVPNAQGSRRVPVWESTTSLHHNCIFYSNSKGSMILNISTIIFI